MSTNKGNAGENLVMAELLAQGFEAYRADRGHPEYDVACFAESGHATRLRVKTTTENGAAIWTARKNGKIFLDAKATDDFVIICDVQNGIRGADMYVVPTPVVEQDLVGDHAFYVAQPGRYGKTRSDSDMRVMRFHGEPKHDNQAFGYQAKYAQYRDAWYLLK